jgi:asparagine synthase (glutamine-hydrolysing)
MCGIAGIIDTKVNPGSSARLEAALDSLSRRGPDARGIFKDGSVQLGHTRLSIIDTSSGGAQPMSDSTGRYTIVFNGEFFNYREQRAELKRRGILLQSESDTEVLLKWYIQEGPDCLKRINGFFALCVYDRLEQSLFLARDRFGVKPLWYHTKDGRFLFASELKALMRMGAPKVIDNTSLHTYLQLNYIPAPWSIFKEVKKLEPGHQLFWKNIFSDPEPVKSRYYEIPVGTTLSPVDYENAKETLVNLLDESVQRRLVADVPLGAFLSGGIDSSVVTALAARHRSGLNTFSIGFRDEPGFDETGHATTVARHLGTNHHVFRLTNDDLFSTLFDTLDYLDEPFADSSALNMFLLSKETRKHVTVALSGDGADEVFSGYNKHAAEWRIRHMGIRERLAILGGGLWKLLPKSRNSTAGNLLRQLDRFAKGADLSPADRYWRWASMADESEAAGLMSRDLFDDVAGLTDYLGRKRHWTRYITGGDDLNDLLRNDVELVLPNDMLTKVDLMSMANSLEVRTPFLDYTVVDFAFSLPSEYKMDGQRRKKIVRDAFVDLLPAEILQRGKQGFEVPLLNWMRKELRSFIADDLLSESFIREQGIFDPVAVRRLLSRLQTNDPGESAGRIWALVVFQYWWKKHMAHGN